jgi:hypothetical protein
MGLRTQKNIGLFQICVESREQSLSFIAVSEMGRKGFHDPVLRNLCAGRNFIWHCKEPRGR